MRSTRAESAPLLAGLALGLTLAATAVAAFPAQRGAAISAAVLLWEGGGCHASWCESGWYSSPAVADLDGNGTPEVIASAYSIVALTGATGNLLWRVASGHDRTEPAASNVGRTWPGIGLTDVDGDGALEIVTAHSGGWVSVYDASGYFESGWPRQPAGSELRGLAIGDVDGDGTAEILVSAAIGSTTNSWLLEHTGATRQGWPQLAQSGVGKGYAWGVYNDNAAIADLDGDSDLELLIPSDVHYIAAYQPNGTPLAASTHFGDKKWGEVGVWVSTVPEERGWGNCDGTPTESHRTNFASGASTVADLDADGTKEVVVTGHTYDCTGVYTNLYNGVYVLNSDRTRYQSAAGNWSQVPTSLGAPLSEDYNVIENIQPNPVVADLDGDGEREILYPD